MQWLRTLLTPPSDSPATEARLVALEQHARSLYDHAAEQRRELRELVSELQQLRQDEARRAAEHATMVDQLTRLYKRVSSRIAREGQTAAAAAENGHTQSEESVMELRRRLGR
jgi:hypothetical protein